MFMDPALRPPQKAPEERNVDEYLLHVGIFRSAGASLLVLVAVAINILLLRSNSIFSESNTELGHHSASFLFQPRCSNIVVSGSRVVERI
jgi:hypothetical protein